MIDISTLQEAVVEVGSDPANAIELCEWGFRIRLHHGNKRMVAVVGWQQVSLAKSNILVEQIRSMREKLEHAA